MVQPGRAQLFRTVSMAMLLLLSACGGPAWSPTATPAGAFPPATPGTPAPAATPAMLTSPRTTLATPSTRPTLADTLATTQRLRISYSGSSQVGKQSADWNLVRSGDHFAGRAQFVGHRYPGPVLHDNAEIKVPSDATTSFFEILGQVTGRPGNRGLPKLQQIILETPTETVEIFYQDEVTDAPEQETMQRRGWSMTRAGTTYLIDSNLPTSALAILAPYLKQDVWYRLFENSRATAVARPTRVPLLCTLPAAGPSANGTSAAGASMNIVATLGIAEPKSITIEDGAEFAKKKLTDPAQIGALIALLDQPLPVIPSTTFNANERVLIDIATADRFSIPIYYLPRAELLNVFDPNNGYSVQAPPELRPMLIDIFCGQ